MKGAWAFPRSAAPEIPFNTPGLRAENMLVNKMDIIPALLSLVEIEIKE